MMRMQWFDDLKIGAKLTVAFVLVAAGAGLIGWVGLSGLRDTTQRMASMYANQVLPLQNLGYANAALLLARAKMGDLVQATDGAQRRESARLIEEEGRKVEEHLEAYRKKALSKEEQETLLKFQSAWEELQRLRGKAITMALGGHGAKAAEILQGEAGAAEAGARKALQALIDLNVRTADQENQINQAAASADRSLVVLLLGMVVVAALGVGMAVARAVGRPLHSMQAVAEKLALGDINVSVDLRTKDELGALAESFRIMIETIKGRAALAEKIAAGDFLVDVRTNSEQDVLGKSFLQVVQCLRRLIAESEALTRAAVEGKLSTRGNAGQFQGGYRTIIEGVNRTLDAVVEPIRAATAALSRIAAKDLQARVPGDYRGDYAQLKHDINQMAADLQESLRRFSQNAQALSSSSEELSAVSQQMAGNAEETATQASVVSAASEQISKSVSSVASASEQMQASIREIARNANESARVAKNAVRVAHSTNETVRKLGDSSLEIGNVIKVITSIAQQTNLLALNATIEAARAGEAGKGFAVVANEVKELAKQTAKATEEIGRKIEAIQGDTQGAVQAIEEIGAIINQISDISNSIASAVEEQTVTTNEIGRSVAEAAKGVGNIANNIGGVAAAAKSTTQGANDTQRASHELREMAVRLEAVVSQFSL
ncbi:MAG TPA: methyl-accepting chemotaxis protein [Bryobacteraceae bacterium]|nr:methyl-accepting chemotaxis protein [Bryobacteraceae bacterium]